MFVLYMFMSGILIHVPCLFYICSCLVSLYTSHVCFIYVHVWYPYTRPMFVLYMFMSGILIHVPCLFYICSCLVSLYTSHVACPYTLVRPVYVVVNTNTRVRNANSTSYYALNGTLLSHTKVHRKTWLQSMPCIDVQRH